MKLKLFLVVLFIFAFFSCSKKSPKFHSEGDAKESLRMEKESKSFPLKEVVNKVSNETDLNKVTKSFDNQDYEIWVIEKKATSDEKQIYERISCKVLSADGSDKLLLPIYETSVKAEINGLVVEVGVQQKYSNPFNKKIEIEYVFPLPENAAISDFVMVIGERKIRGFIREKEEAKQIYDSALKSGLKAALMTQERENVFKQKIANVEPFKHIQINIQYFYNLNLQDGEYQFVFPTVVGPRYFPKVDDSVFGPDFNATSVRYTNKEIDHRVNVDLVFSKEFEKYNIICKSHQTQKINLENGRVHLLGLQLKPDKDIVIKITPNEADLTSQLLSQKTEKGEFFALSVMPSNLPKSTLQKLEQEVVFVLDCSGSMNGWPLSRAKKMVEHGLKRLNENDSFQLIQFSNTAKTFSRIPVAATVENKVKALEYLENMNSSGGTEMIQGIKAALNYPQTNRERIIMFMTDGFIGNESDILKEVYSNIGKSRIFSFGIGSSVNRYLLKELAIAGRGGVAYIMEDKDAREEVGLFFDRMAKPVLKDVTIDWKDWVVTDVYPNSISNLYYGMPKLITGKILKRGVQSPEIIGLQSDQKSIIEINLVNVQSTKKSCLEKIWARNQISMCSRLYESGGDQEKLNKDILNISLDYQVLSQFSAFLALDALEVVSDRGQNIKAPSVLPLPNNK